MGREVVGLCSEAVYLLKKGFVSDSCYDRRDASTDKQNILLA